MKYMVCDTCDVIIEVDQPNLINKARHVHGHKKFTIYESAEDLLKQMKDIKNQQLIARLLKECSLLFRLKYWIKHQFKSRL